MSFSAYEKARGEHMRLQLFHKKLIYLQKQVNKEVMQNDVEWMNLVDISKSARRITGHCSTSTNNVIENLPSTSYAKQKMWGDILPELNLDPNVRKVSQQEDDDDGEKSN